MVQVLIALNWASSTWASSSGVLQGRLWLAESNLPSAYQAFSTAVGDDPADDEARVLKTLSALALLQKNATITNYIQSFHISSPANIWLARDQGYRTNANAPTPYRTEPALSSTQGVTILTNVILPVLFQAESDLAGVSSTNVLVSLGRSETGFPDITLDYGDILMIRSLVASGISATYLIRSQNTVTLFNDIFDLEEAPGPATIELWLQHFPDFAKSAHPQDLPLSRAKAQDALVLYNQASTWIRTYRTPDQVRLFNLPGSFGVRLGTFYTASLAEEELFRSKLNEYAAGLDGPVLVTGADEQPIDTFNAKPFFDGQRDLRLLTPPFRKNKIRQGSVTDATFGGIWATNSVNRLESLLLQETYYAAFDPYAFGLFIPPQVTVEALPETSLSETHEPTGAFLGLGSVRTQPPVRYDYSLGLFWLNPMTSEVSRLSSHPPTFAWAWIQEAALHDNQITMVVPEYGPTDTVYRIRFWNILSGIQTEGVGLSFGGDFWVNQIQIAPNELVVTGWSNLDGDRIRRVNSSTGLITDLGPVEGGLQWGSLSIDPTGAFVSFVYQKYDAVLGAWDFFLEKRSITNGSTISRVPMHGGWPYLFKLLMPGGELAYGIKAQWSETGEELALYSLNFQSGEVLLVDPSLLPSGRLLVWNSFKLSIDGQHALLQSHDGTWRNLQLHKIRLNDGVLISSQNLGSLASTVDFQHLFEVSGRFLYAKRTGDLSENIILQLTFSGTAQSGHDFSMLDADVLTLPPGNVEHPVRFALIDDGAREFTEIINISGTPDSPSEATFQPFTLTILDNDGGGVGIFTTDNEGREGRLDPDPLGFNLTPFNPIRYEVRRTGDTSAALAVKVDRDLLLSSASSEDYEISGFDVDGETVNIPAGQSSAEIVVSPKFDFQYPEGDESLVLQIQEDSGYALTENVEASALILDSSVYEWWTYQNGLVVSNLPPTWDLDGDGSPNLLEMALGRDPQIPDSSESVQLGQDADGYLTLTFKRWAGGTNQPDGSYIQYGLTYSPQSTSNLANPGSWSGSSLETVSTVPATDGMETVTVRDTHSKNSTRRFIRVLVIMNQ